ncbi:interleukin-15 receptor subunit alpha isoform X2 [Rana temporaria]|uniref:interleukin-15 receptor subunit alpha isoform X2 n=1 Tax=Rana temporaria TaxID=8407 RepID=UPI001AAC9214|nr:interleukin-15 receptor subunit alpha isoform X2 [Rana temporaria]
MSTLEAVYADILSCPGCATPQALLTHCVCLVGFNISDCGALKTVKNAEVEQFSETDKYIRYRCLDGYKRKAGTSNFAICVFNSTTKKAYWKYGNLSCIRDPSLPMTTHSTLTSPTTSDQQHYTAFPTTGASTKYIMDTTSSTTSGSQSTTILPTTVGKATVKTTTQQPRSSEHAATSRETTQSVPETPELSTISYYTTTGHDSSIPGSQSTTILATSVGKATVKTTTQQPKSSEHAVTSRETTQSVPESTYISTDETKLSTIGYYTMTGHDSSIPDPSLWQQEKTIGSIAGVLLLFLTLLVIWIVIWMKRRNQHSPVPQEELNQEHDYSNDQEELAEESTNL